MPRDDEIQLSSETINRDAEELDINTIMVAKFNDLERKISQLKIKFEAHKISRSKSNAT